MQRTVLNRITAAARSGFRRYPRHLLHSVRDLSIFARSTHSSPPLFNVHGSHPLPAEQSPPPHPILGNFNTGSDDLSAIWIGHATVLLRIAGQTILTDPVFSNRIGVSLGRHTFGISRLAPPAVDPASLPPIDAVLLSHAHFDHLDKPSLLRLVNPRTTVITAPRTKGLIPHGFRSVVELPWEGRFRLGEIEITAMQPAHWGARTALDRRRGFNSYLLDSSGSTAFPPHRVLFAGDTAHTDSLDAAGGGALDLAIFGIGAYDPWENAHATPEQVWSMFTRLNQHGAAHLLPMHHSTFELSDEHRDEPMKRLLDAAGNEALRVVCRQIGQFWNMNGTPRS
ncbi:MAG: MBL fold metallo-hydrolase [Pyrinomonadaceae bacterium]|nr:MBL fold metallo-hydrolase [Phycisphaerales bacterium]